MKLFRWLSVVAAAFVLAMSFAQMSVADQRFETEQGLCHFAYDPADDDNEVYFANCVNTIDTHDRGDGQGRLAYGSSSVSARYMYGDGTTPKGLNLVFPTHLKGTAAGDRYPGEVSNTQCVMVTSNYNGDGTNNYTQYVTDDWSLIFEPVVHDGITGELTYKFDLDCRNGVAQ